MKYLNTLPNSFIVGEKDNDGNILEQYGFPKGGLTYLITGNNIKFYLTEDYFYKNVVWSADAPLLINGVPISVDNLPAALKNIFKVEQEAVDVDTEFDDQSFNPIANAPVTIKFNEVDALQATISGEVESLSGEVQTKADIEDIPTNVSELVNDAGYITQEELSEDYATKVWVQDQGYLTEHQDISGKQDVSGMTAYTTNDAFSTHTGNTDIHVTANEKETWNNKSDFSGSYNDLTDKPTIPVVPTNVSDFVNDAGYVTQNDIDESVSGKADTSAVTASLAALDEKKLDASAYTPTDLSNYYTKDETSGATEIATALDGKADIEDIPTNVSELVNDEGYVTQNDIDAAVSGKVNTTDFNTYSAATDNRLSEDEEVTAAALNALNAVSGDVSTLSGQVATISGDVNTLSGSVESIHSAVSDVVGDVSTLSGKVNTDETILTGHTANTDIHVTASDKQNWNNKSDFSGDYNDLTNKPTIPAVPTNVSDFVNDAGYATSGYVDSSVSGKVNTTDFNTYSAATDNRLSEDEEVTAAALNELNDALDSKADLEDIPTNVSELVNDAGYATSGYVNTAIATKQDTLVSGTNIKTINNESLLGSGNIDIQGGGNNVIELTQAEYDELTDIDPDAFYIITDAAGAVTTGQVQTMIDDSISGKQDTLVSGTNIKTINNESILGSGNIDIQGGGGGGKAISAGTNISVTTGETADTINCTLPISVSNTNRIKISQNNNSVNGNNSIIVGGSHNTADADHTHVGGRYNSATNDFETAFGNANISNKANTTYGNSGNTLLSVGNGVNSSIHHNAFEIRQNGDIYIADTNDTTYQNYYQKPMIKLQDALGGGGGGKAIVAGTNISVTTGETADTINCTLPITASTSVRKNDIAIGNDIIGVGDYKRIIIGNGNKNNYGNSRTANSILIGTPSNTSSIYNVLNATNCIGIGGNGLEVGYDNIGGSGSIAIGYNSKSIINNSLAIGTNTVASGTTKTNINNQLTIDTSNQVYIYNKDNTEMICLQDQLGGGGVPESAFTTYTASTDARLAEDEEVTAAALNSLNDALSDKADTSAVTESINAAVSGKADTSAFTAHTADTTIHTTSAEKASWNGAVTALGGLKLVSLTQAQYDALATKDASTLFIIVN